MRLTSALAFLVFQVQSSTRPEQQPAEEEQQEDEDSDEVGMWISCCLTIAIKRILLTPSLCCRPTFANLRLLDGSLG